MNKTTNRCYSCGATDGIRYFTCTHPYICVEPLACSARAVAKRETAIKNDLTLAMLVAGIEGEVTVTLHTERTDAYADYSGYLVKASTPELLSRAVKWTSAMARRHATSGSCAGQVVQIGKGHFVQQDRWSLGD